MIERRRHERIRLNLPVILRHGGRLLFATALNLSCGGACLRADGVDIASDAPVEIIFDLGEGKKDLSMLGRITRIIEENQDASDIGVQFTNLFSLSHKAVQEYLGKQHN